MKNQYGKWIVLQLKKNLSSGLFWIILIMMVCVGFLCKEINHNQEENMEVLLYVEDTHMGEEIATELLKQELEGYSFQKTDSLERLKESIIKGDSSCGFYFPKELDDALLDRNLDKHIQIYKTPGSIDGYVVEEVVAAKLLYVYSEFLLSDYLDKWDEIEQEQRQWIINRNEEYLESLGLQIFSIQTVDTPVPQLFKTIDLEKGILYLFLFLVALLGVYQVETGEEMFIYQSLGRKRSCFFMLIQITILVELIALLSGVVLMRDNLLQFCLFGIVSIFWGILFRLLCRKNQIFIGLIPFIVFINLIVSPILFDLSEQIPFIGFLQKLFPLGYFL